ncbi:ubiquinol oxidase subunit II [Candidatus Saccharibacteria bacterium]|nr:ubiquinol oxidase subunit II [Candidatus Saccharibacteria bacterium]
MKRLLQRILRLLSRVHIPESSRVPRVIVVLGWVIGLTLFVILLAYLLRGQTVDVLQTKGEIGNRQRDLLYFAGALAVLILLPVYVMLFAFAWRYRTGHKRAYQPDWDTDKRYEAVWWGIPIAIITVLAVVTWVTSHSLDPYKPLASDKKPLQVQVIALQWKWLFIYPAQSVASVNELTIPVDQPVEFSITADAPMNSFWIPQLGGQIYAMNGMVTKLNLEADHTGNYRGMSSNISGKGFADMQFMTRAVSPQSFNDWVETIHQHKDTEDLTAASFAALNEPGTSGVIRYHVHDSGIFGTVLMKYMGGHMMSGGMYMESDHADQMVHEEDM